MMPHTLYLAWQDKAKTRQWYPVGRLDVDTPTRYRFAYVRGAERARKESGFEPLFDFPSLYESYEASELFPLFKNRLLRPEREDFAEYIRQLDLTDVAEPLEILAIGGGQRATDSFEVFPRIERREDGAFKCRFFLHGWRHTSDAAQTRLAQLRPDEPLHIAIELTNPVAQLTVQLQTQDYHMIGWAPRYLVADLVGAISRAPGNYAAKVVQLNPAPAPSKQRLLIELTGHWPAEYEPMSTPDFELLAH
jgi:hypothetical protein